VATVTVRQAVGDYGERIAAARLEALGMTILERNWRCATGEIDIVARDGDVLVVCEVKTRRSGDFGGPLEAVTPVKARRLCRLAACWLRDHPNDSPASVRIDVVGVMRPPRGAARVDYLRGAL
jgi:putative endonuclease